VSRTMRMFPLALLAALVLAACGGSQEAPAAAPAAATAAATEAAPASATETATEAAAASGPISGQRTFVIVPEQSKASYVVDESFFGGALAKYGIAAGNTKTTGGTQQIEGQLQLNLDNLNAALGDNHFTVKLNTLVSDQDRRDQWIRDNGPAFNQFPEATFVAKSIEGAPSAYDNGQEVGFKLSGDLTVRNITKPVTFDINAKLAGDTLSGTATTRVKLTDFGIEPPNFANTLTVEDEFTIQVDFVAKG
jgi:polyisoprenoid-binding protein YceI